MKKTLLTLALLPVFSLAAIAQNDNSMITQTLQSAWAFKSSSKEGWMPATVPGCVHTDLIDNGVIEDPFYRLNEHRLQWVDKDNWAYRTAFQVDGSILDKERVALEFLGLDTYADVYLNDKLILLADNFHRSWEVDVKPYLKADSNELYILFHSPIQIGLENLDAHGYGLPAVNDQSENGGVGDKKVSVFLRKPGYHFGWDWGPRLTTSGIWRPILIKAWNEARLVDAYFHQESVSAERALLDAQLTVEAERAGPATLSVYWQDSLLARKDISLKAGAQQASLPLEILKPKLWWTKELGEPYLYPLKVVLEMDGRTSGSLEKRIGLRSIRVVQEPDADGKGSSFYFELNGKPIFSKGANYIPNDVFLNRVSPEWYRKVIQSATDANMNMLRIWGGGFYEDDYFYTLCDEQGILIWQDFMFACSMYPGDSSFIESVRQEAIYNIRRLRNHPSIALWCGNNEIDVAWAQYKETMGWGWKQRYTMKQRATIWAAYERVFHQLLPELVKAYHPGAFYWPSSPYAGPGEHATYNTTSGDIHYWGVWHGEHPFRDFRKYIGRFMSEYGFQSFPEYQSVRKYALPEDFDIESEVMASHQRSGIGNLRIRSYMKDNYQLPERFDQFLYVGQLLQAEAIKYAIEAHRTAKPYCMGTLYWQINDCWPVASWSSMDYYLRWKALHYYVRDAYKRETVVFIDSKDKLKVYTCSGRMEPATAQLRLELLNFDGQVLWQQESDTRLSPDSALVAADFDIKQFNNLGSRESMVLRARLYENGQLLHENLYYFTEPRSLKLPAAPQLTTSWAKQTDGSYALTLASNALAKNVFLSYEGVDGFFSDNYFDLLPGEQKTVSFSPDKPHDEPLDASGLSVMHLAETMAP
ncbi:MAG: glycoside hydrolase family 2 protein [Phaeodactylibacter sp.]|nr:glycoside hydrolase family 2 protein [Phaeodactylibacter sp.]